MQFWRSVMVDKMEIDSTSDFHLLKPRDRVIKGLAQFGIPEECLDQPGLVAFVKKNKSLIPELVSVILPKDEEVVEVMDDVKDEEVVEVMDDVKDEEVVEVMDDVKGSKKLTMEARFRESMAWLQWLMFEGDPTVSLRNLKMSGTQRGVCGSVWGQNDIAYRCRTCEHDPTCAICVPCFENGNHKGHDYNVIYTGGGCCDCGDVTAWKREGFCSKHKGTEQIQPLREDYANSVAPVLSSLFNCWKDKLAFAESMSQKNSRPNESVTERKKKIANELTFVVVEMLLEFCKHSESLLSFVARLLFTSTGLLGILVRAERFLDEDVVRKLHELLLKLLGEPIFKYEFAKVFLAYYPSVISEATKENGDTFLKSYPLLPTFSVQILTVSTLTPRLVKEINLLAMLLGCLEEIFTSCAGEDGRLMVARWGNLHETTLRVVEDIRFVMSHVMVSKYVICDQQDILRTWMKLVSIVQGINPLKRETGLHIEEENENIHLPFILCHSISNIHSLLVEGAFTDASKGETVDEILWSSNKQESDDGDNLRHTKVGRLSQESSACSAFNRNIASACSSKVSEIKSYASPDQLLPSSVTWLTYECLKAIENWWGVDKTCGIHPNMLSPNSSINDSSFSAIKKTLYHMKMKNFIFGSKPASSREDNSRQFSDYFVDDLENSKYKMKAGKVRANDETDLDKTSSSSYLDDSTMETDFPVELDGLRFLSLSDWPDIVYDVSSQDISVHIPLHRLLSLLLQKAMKRYFGESVVPDMSESCSANSSSTIHTDFFGHALGRSHPYGFSAFIMEHPLRIRVFCAEVHAGMWRKNGDAALLSCEWYRTVRWYEQSLEHDLFLLQCCAALAPADLFVSRILERFGLSSYLSLSIERSSEYEPVLVQEMLILIIQIVKERCFCGLTTTENLKRELVCKLAAGDATHSQLVKSLPRELSKFEKIQEILDEVAVYSNPSGFNQGMYSLRWAFWKELDLYHPRWNSKDLQVAEERYLRFCSVSALTTQLPRWTKIYPPLHGISRIATCKVVLQIIRAVLFYAVFTFESAESRAPDVVLLTALHLLSLSLDICFQQKESDQKACYDEAQIPIIALSREIIEVSSYDIGEQSLLSLLVLLMRMHRREDLDNSVEVGGCSLSALIERLLRKFAEIDDKCLTKLQQLAPEIVSHLSECNSVRNSGVSVSASDSEKRKAKARERQAAILEKMRVQQSKFLASVDSTVNDGSQVEGDFDIGPNAEESTHVVCSLCHDHNSKHPISFLILLQKSRLVSFVDRGPPSWAQLSRSDKGQTSIPEKVIDTLVMKQTSGSSGSAPSSQLNQLVQNAANELASHGHPGEVNAFLRYIRGHIPALGNVVPDTSYDEKEKTLHTFETLEQDIYLSICEEMCKIMPCLNLMNEDEKISTAGGNRKKIRDAGSVLLGKYIAELSQEILENSSSSESVQRENASVESSSQPTAYNASVESSLQPSAYDGFGPKNSDGIHLSSCGHAVHQGCLDRYLSSLKERSVRRIVFEGGHIVDPDQGEFLCPVCRRLVNCVLPTLPGDLQKPFKNAVNLNVDSILAADPLASSRDTCPLRLKQALMILQSAANTVGKDEFLKAIPLRHQDRTTPNLEPFSRVLSKMYLQSKQDKLSRSSRVNHSVLMWDTLKYSLISMEISARCGRTSMTPNYDLSAMYKDLKSSSGFTLSLLLKLVQKTRSKNSLDVLQRFRGVQHFAESVCSGIPLNFGSQGLSKTGDMSSILKDIEMEVSNTDLQFWSRVSHPILAHDPFSTLMWVLFCLPCPVLSCEEFLLSLIHTFYLVSVTQTIILYCGKFQHKLSESGLSDCLITDVYNVMGKSGCAQQYFVSNYLDPNVDIKVAIQKFSFPYLRRCALLWELLFSSIPAPFCDGDNVLDRSWNVSYETMVSSDIGVFELTKVQELEDMFKIPSLDVVIKDELSRSLALSWCRHFLKEFESNGIQHNMHVSPAVPFELMRLPHVYQDLLRRCIKQRCPGCKTPLKESALCLLCGRSCCPNWRSCCSQSACQNHAIACGAGTGVFLLIRRTTILLQRSARQAPWPSPYLDEFGEEDYEMHRGKPLYLNEERYAALTYMVASHGLDRSSKVLGQTSIETFTGQISVE